MSNWTEDMIEQITKKNGNTPNGVIRDADTILVDLINNADFEETGIAQEVFDIWKESKDKKSVERLFELFTDMSFDMYLQKCDSEITTE